MEGDETMDDDEGDEYADTSAVRYLDSDKRVTCHYYRWYRSSRRQFYVILSTIGLLRAIRLNRQIKWLFFHERSIILCEQAVEDEAISSELPLVPLMVVPWATVPKGGVRPYCHFENCKQKFSSKNSLAIHLVNNHDNYIIDVSGSSLHFQVTMPS